MSKLIMENIDALMALSEQEREIVIIEALGEGLGNETVKALKQGSSGEGYSNNLNKLLKELQSWCSEEGAIERAQELWRGCKLDAVEILDTVKRERTAKGRVEKLGIYRLSELTEEERNKKPEFVIDGIIPVGLTFIIGGSKLGKSFLALQLCEAVKHGTEFLGKKAKQAEALYLDLEGSKFSISERAKTTGIEFSFMMMHLSDEFNSTIAGEGENSLIEDLRALKLTYKELKLIVIDTYGYVRGAPKLKGQDAYYTELSMLKPMKKLAHELGIALVFIHHESKGADKTSDISERGSGSVAIFATADAVFNLFYPGKRNEGSATLAITERDARSTELKVSFDKISCIWHLEGKADDAILKSSVFKWVINNLPERSKSKFFYYSDIAKQSGLQVDEDGRAGDAVKRELEPMLVQDELYNKYGAIIQMGQRGSDGYGIRICRK